MPKAFAYYRTSSATNVGQDKDSETRQRLACEAYAKAQGYEIVAEFYDAAVSGADPLDARPGFAALLQALAANGVRTILLENASRFARDLLIQEVGYKRLAAQGIDLIAVDAPNSFIDDTPTNVLIRQVIGALAQFDRAQTVAKLKAARDRKRQSGLKCEGPKSLNELKPEAVAMARSLRDEGATLRTIAAKLAENGLVSRSGKPFEPSTVMRALKRA
jgi:DNA invertase Pin-like site-specific DNA recombinase